MFSNSGFEADYFNGSGAVKTEGTRTTRLDGAAVSEFQFNRFESRSAALPKSVAPAEATSDEPDETMTGTGNGGLKKCMKRFTSLMLSHFGTMVLVILYILMGGFLFQYLERENEISGCSTKFEKYNSKRNEAVDRVYNMAQGGNASLSKSAIFNELKDFSTEVYQLGVDPLLNCSTLGSDGNWPRWNFANAAYFSATIVTTIGYGHITPATQWGQIVCMIYAILGIPLMLLFLTKIGEPTAMLFRAFYLNIFCCKCFIKKLPYESNNFNNEGETGQQQLQQQQQQQTSWRTVEDGVVKQAPAKVSELVVVEDDEEEGDEEEEVVNIPITVTIMLLMIYILIGAAVFRVWEEWTLIEGTYFSFITLSTIGFGDYVPGKDGPFNDTWIVTELLVGSVYCVFGLAMLSMCINLIQDEISAKFHWIAGKLGMSRNRSAADPDDDDEDEDDEDEEDDDDEEDDTDEEAVSQSGNGSAVKKRHSAATAARGRSAASSGKNRSSFA